jgi:hypothetical protein
MESPTNILRKLGSEYYDFLPWKSTIHFYEVNQSLQDNFLLKNKCIFLILMIGFQIH